MDDQVYADRILFAFEALQKAPDVPGGVSTCAPQSCMAMLCMSPFW